MLNDDQYMERTPDLIAKVRQMREAAEKQMNRFTRVADFDVRRAVGQKQKVEPTADGNSPEASTPSGGSQSEIAFPVPPPAAASNDREGE